ncbi:MAG: hypothetical protein HOP21_07200 [Methylotenera sp.]|nr:hypothetical protein [Methylotenera sp.]
MPYKLFDYVNAAGENEIKKWISSLEKKHRAKLNQKLDTLKIHGKTLLPELLSRTSESGIYKIRVHGNVQLRPLLCEGTVDVNSEFTLLLGAKEIGDKWVPKGAPTKANEIKSIVLGNPQNRRVNHERVT